MRAFVSAGVGFGDDEDIERGPDAGPSTPGNDVALNACLKGC